MRRPLAVEPLSYRATRVWADWQPRVSLELLATRQPSPKTWRVRPGQHMSPRAGDLPPGTGSPRLDSISAGPGVPLGRGLKAQNGPASRASVDGVGRTRTRRACWGPLTSNRGFTPPKPLVDCARHDGGSNTKGQFGSAKGDLDAEMVAIAGAIIAQPSSPQFSSSQEVISV